MIHMYNETLITNAETLVCEAVNRIFMELRPEAAHVSVNVLYNKKGNIPLPVATARHFCFRLLHDRYGLPYSVIAQRAGMNVSSVIKKVRKVRLMVFTDVIYRKVDKYINEKLEINNE